MCITPKPLYFDKELPVFVGREEDLIKFNKKWQNPSEMSSIIKIANMPGIGKTEVVKQFYRTYGMEEKALMIYINCKEISAEISRITSPSNAYKLTRKMYRNILSQIEWHFEQFGKEFPSDLRKELEEILNYKESFFSYMNEIFKLPFFNDTMKLFFFDEIQTLYGKGVNSILIERDIFKAEKWISEHPDEEPNKDNCSDTPLIENVKMYKQGAFREMSYLMSTLISPYNLIFVSGTQYRLLNSLGDLGSPLLGRVITHDLSRLSRAESRQWIDLVIPDKDTQLWNSICETVIQLSGGIPRILQVYIDELKDNLDRIIDKFSKEYKVAEMDLIRSANSVLDQQYVMFRINQLMNQYGERMKRLLSRMARHYMFYDYSTETEISTWIDFLWSRNGKPHVSDLVEAGLLLRGNGNVVDDYTNHHSEQYRPNYPIVMVSKHVHNLMRERFLDDMWLEEMDIILDTDTLNILRIAPSVVGFAFEYYFALRILQLSKDNLVLIENGISPYFSNINRNISLSLNRLQNVLSYTSINAINPISENIIYLLSTETAIDGLIMVDDITVLYQLKFTKKALVLNNRFYDNIIKHEKIISEKTANNVIKILFTDKEPTQTDMDRLNKENILVCSDLELLLGERMINWLRDAKLSKISL